MSTRSASPRARLRRRGQIRQVPDGVSETTFLYDAGGNRLLRREPSSTTLYLGGVEIRRSPAGAVGATRHYTHGGQTVAVRTNDNYLTWFGSDAQGTHQFAVDTVPQAFERRRFTPFGAERGAAPAVWAGDKSFVGGTKDWTPRPG
jgi:hypothetical protein